MTQLRRNIPPSRVQSKYFPMEGGLNLTDPALNLKAGECLASINHEPAIPRGYRRVEGYERFDGQPAPSEAAYWLLQFDNGSTEVQPGTTITSEDGANNQSGITGRVLVDAVVLTGTWAGGDATGYIVLVDVAYAGPDSEFTIGDILTYDDGGEVQWATVLQVEEKSGVNTGILPCLDTMLSPDGKYLVVEFDVGTNEPTPGTGNRLVGQLSGTSGCLYSIAVVESGSWAGNDATGFMLVINNNGQRYTPDEVIDIIPDTPGGVVTKFAEAKDAGEEYVGASAGVYYHYLHLAQEDRRVLIETVPGQDAVRGVWMYKGIIYAFRDKVGGASAGMYKATATGWVEQALGSQLGFNGAEWGAIPLDVQLVGATSGAVGIIERVATSTGDYTENDKSSGEMILSATTGTFLCGETLIADGTIVAYASEGQVANTIAAGGHYEFHNYNFYGSSQFYRMYGCNGVDTAFEWDGTIFAKIKTGMELDTPTHIRAYAYHLFLAFPGGSLQHSSLGEPLEWNVLSGAGEMGMGDDITGMSIEADNVMTVISRNSVHMLYGTSAADFVLKPFHQNVGGIEWTAQKIGQTWFLDDRGLTTLTGTNDYGDFAQNSVSIKVDPFIQPRMGDVRSSQIVRNKNQYRIYFGDSWALFGTFEGNKVLGFMPIQYKVQPYCTESVEDESGYEYLFMGCDDGYVYQQDIGTSFDGESVFATLMLNYYHYDTPTYNKRFRGITFELDILDNTDIKFLPDFSYGSEEIPRAVIQQNIVVGGGGLWDYALWDEFLWSGQVISTGRNRIDGVGSNMGLMLFSESKYLQSYTMQGATVAYSIRRLIR